jgi:hypothetical protein
MKKNILSFALIAAIIGSIAAGCGSQKSATTGSDSTKKDTTKVTTPAPTTPTDTAKKDTTKKPPL